MSGSPSCPRVYPRVCGGTFFRLAFALRKSGLSPRVRGNPVLDLGVPVAPGSIPACAGEPAIDVDFLYRCQVYPRVCGGTPSVRPNSSNSPGLSPRVRGNQRGERYAAFQPGSIPACAGEPSRPTRRSRLGGVYPRVCGGTSTCRVTVVPAKGLSPRVRGNQGVGRGGAVRDGSIPACAGEPGASFQAADPPRVYPRVCGGTRIPIHEGGSLMGLSPRVRGNRPTAPTAWSDHGSIPACAGEPRRTDSAKLCTRVYPRVCGGTSGPTARHVSESGLSPRVRGNRHQLIEPPHPSGSIPACAGEPRTPFSMISSMRVYPRVCGGTPCAFRDDVSGSGLSPRVRGNLYHDHATLWKLRSIPACAGEPFMSRRSVAISGVYPRVCGGTATPPSTAASSSGLSPRVRGNL